MRCTFPAFLVLVTLSSPAPARAGEEDKETIEIAKEFMELGQALYTAGKFEEAAGAFVNAYKTQPFAAFLYNTGVAYEKAGMFKEAADYFRRYLEDEPGSGDAKKILARIEALEKAAAGKPEGGGKPTFIVEKTCGGEGQPPCEGGEEAPPAEVSMKSIVQVRTEPAGAKVEISDLEGTVVQSSVSPVEVTVEPGKYSLSVSHPEYKKAVTPLVVSEGRVYVVHVEMSQGTFLGYLTVKCDVPGADVFLDDRDAGAVGQTPWGNAVPTGDHVVWIERPGYETMEKTVSVGVGDTVEIDALLERVGHGEIEVVTNVDDAVLSVDGKVQAGALPLTLQLPAGPHGILVEAKGLKAYALDLDLLAGMRTKVLVRLNPKPKRTPAWISLGLATAFLVAGVALAATSTKLENEMEHDRSGGYLDNNDPRADKLLGLDIGADASFLLAGIMTVVGLVYMFRDPLPDSEGKVKDPVEFADLTEGSK